MNIKTENVNGDTVCRMTGALTIWEAADTWQQIKPLLSKVASVTLDMARVDECDGAGIQILCQARQVISKQGGTLHIEAISEAVFAALQMAGMDSGFFANSRQEV